MHNTFIRKLMQALWNYIKIQKKEEVEKDRVLSK
jgi:hypothetical protein